MSATPAAEAAPTPFRPSPSPGRMRQSRLSTSLIIVANDRASSHSTRASQRRSAHPPSSFGPGASPTITFAAGEAIPPGLPRGEIEARVHAAINALNP